MRIGNFNGFQITRCFNGRTYQMEWETWRYLQSHVGIVINKVSLENIVERRNLIFKGKGKGLTLKYIVHHCKMIIWAILKKMKTTIFTSDTNKSQLNQKIDNDNLLFFDTGRCITWWIIENFYITSAPFYKHSKLHLVIMAQKSPLAKGNYICPYTNPRR